MLLMTFASLSITSWVINSHGAGDVTASRLRSNGGDAVPSLRVPFG